MSRSWQWASGACLVAACVVVSCAPNKPAAPPPPYNVSLDVKEVMGHVVDPAAWAVWHSSGEVTTATGTQSLVPTTDEGWLAAESGAAAIAEAGNILMLPGRAQDQGDWMKYARQLTEAGIAAKAAAEAKDGQRMFTTGAAIYQVCTDCHAKYVIPFVPKDTSWPEHPKLPEITAKDLSDLKASAH